jgi:hypothetical protein
MRVTPPHLVAALGYAEQGWAVLPLHAPERGGCSCGHPCGSVGKHPRLAHGVKDASHDPTLIRAWWQQWPRANVGIATGAASGLVVLDVDPRHAGEDTLATLQRHYQPLLPTLTAATGGGGWHLFFQQPAKSLIRNTTALLGLPGVDVRGEGGYVVAAPSLHASGASYRWVDAQIPVAPLPSWLKPLLLPHEPTPQARPLPCPGSPSEAGRYWLARALEHASPGQRNVVGFWLSCQLRDADLRLGEAEEVLRTYAAQAPPGDHPYRVREALASLHSAYQHAARLPTRHLLFDEDACSLPRERAMRYTRKRQFL